MLRDSLRVRRLLLLGFLLGIVAFLYFQPWQLKISGQGSLRAVNRSGVFAPERGTVSAVYVGHGDPIDEDQPLVDLTSTELSVEYQEAVQDMIGVREELKIKTTQRGERGLSVTDKVELDGRIAELTQRLKFLERREQLLESRLASLKVKSPMAGRLATWNPRQQLINRPVSAGDMLLHIIDENGPWQLELTVPDVDSGYIELAWERRDPDLPGVPVEYVLATHPDREYRGWLVDISSRTESIGTEHLVYMTIQPDPEDMPPLRDGAEVRAKIHCGERSLGFVLFREVIEFVHSRILF